MRRMTVVAMALVAALAGGTVTPTAAEAAQPIARAETSRPSLQPVQYYGDNWGHRHHGREHRRARDEARINEAARREAMRIERERAERRAWRHSQRQQYGHYRGW